MKRDLLPSLRMEKTMSRAIVCGDNSFDEALGTDASGIAIV